LYDDIHLRRGQPVLILALLFVTCLLLHWRAGTLDSEFGRYQDEGIHYVTGLLVHDFLLSGHWSAPMRFAERFYVHFPKVGLGNWPIGFPLIQTAWTLVFGVSRVSLLMCMFLLTALLAFAVYRAAAEEFGTVYALLAALLLIASPLTQEQSAMVMTEIPLALTSFLAIVALTRFLQLHRTSDSLAFAGWTAAAILIKGDGWVIVFVVPLALLFTQRLRLLLNPRTWLAAIVVGILCIPYTLFTLRIVTQGWDTRTFPGFGYLSRSLEIHTGFAIGILGVPLTCVAFLGIVDRVLLPALRRKAEPFWAVVAIYGAAVVLFHTAVPTSIEPRKIYQIVPVVCLFVPAGVSAIACLIRARVALYLDSPPRVSALRYGLAALAAVVFFAGTFSLLPVYKPGFGPVVEALIGRTDTRGAAILISSNPFTADAEAALIAEWAERDRRDGSYLVRGTKLLARPVSAGPNQLEYALIYQSRDEMRQAMAAVPISYAILDTAPAPRSYRHHALLRAMLLAHPEEWELIYRSGQRTLGAVHEVEVYRLRKNVQGVPIRLSVDLTSKIDRTLRTDSPE
jgi:4-amino-4-deoxy-L-arabinose transferase-like glycosyltransferase